MTNLCKLNEILYDHVIKYSWCKLYLSLFKIIILGILLFSCAMDQAPDTMLNGKWNCNVYTSGQKSTTDELTFRGNRLMTWYDSNSYYYIYAPKMDLKYYLYYIQNGKIYLMLADSNYFLLGAGIPEIVKYSISGNKLTFRGKEYTKE